MYIYIYIKYIYIYAQEGRRKKTAFVGYAPTLGSHTFASIALPVCPCLLLTSEVITQVGA